MKHAAKNNSPKPEARDCVERMEALSGEFRAAIEAIAANDVAALEASVERQAQGCTRLRAALHLWRPELELAKGAAVTPADKVTFVHAARGLSRALKEYAAVMDHSGRSMRMLQALYGQRARNGEEAHVGAAARRPGLSWEV